MDRKRENDIIVGVLHRPGEYSSDTILLAIIAHRLGAQIPAVEQCKYPACGCEVDYSKTPALQCQRPPALAPADQVNFVHKLDDIMDAARYRWLRSKLVTFHRGERSIFTMATFAGGSSGALADLLPELDATIDAEIRRGANEQR